MFNSYGDEVNEAWNAFNNKFPGVALDWSDALGASFNEVLFEHATSTLGQLSVQKKTYIHTQGNVMSISYGQ